MIWTSDGDLSSVIAKNDVYIYAYRYVMNGFDVQYALKRKSKRHWRQKRQQNSDQIKRNANTQQNWNFAVLASAQLKWKFDELKRWIAPSDCLGFCLVTVDSLMWRLFRWPAGHGDENWEQYGALNLQRTKVNESGIPKINIRQKKNVGHNTFNVAIFLLFFFFNIFITCCEWLLVVGCSRCVHLFYE